MASHYLKNVVNSLHDEQNLVQSLLSIIPCLLAVPNKGADPTTLAKLHARLSSLLQSKSPALRWAGTCLIKTTLQREDGRWESLISHGDAWIKLLLRILERDTDEMVVERSVATLDAIFRMTEDKPALTRDLTTPSLPTYLNHIFVVMARGTTDKLKKDLLTYLQGMLVKHPTTFRPFAGKLQAQTLSLLNGSTTDRSLVGIAAHAYASLYLCAPKGSATDQWSSGVMTILGSCHDCLAYVFSPVAETAMILPLPRSLELLPFSTDYTSQVGLAIRRLEALLAVLKAFISQEIREKVKIPLGQIVMLLTRMLAITPASGIKASTPQSTQIALLSALPEIHTLAFATCTIIYNVFGTDMYQHAHELQKLSLAILQSTSFESCKIAGLTCLSKSLSTFGFINDETERNQLLQCVRSAVMLLRRLEKTRTSSVTANGQNGTHSSKKRKHATHGSDQISDNAAFHIYPSHDLVQTSVAFLAAVLTHTTGQVPKGTRSHIDITILKLLTIGQIDSVNVNSLLSLLKCSLLSPEASPSASAILTTSIRLVSIYAHDACLEIRNTASEVLNDLELFIHPRFPAIRRRYKQQELDDLEAEEDAEGNIHEFKEEEIELVETAGNVHTIDEPEATSIDAAASQEESVNHDTEEAQPLQAQVQEDNLPLGTEPGVSLPTPLTEKPLSGQFVEMPTAQGPESKKLKLDQPPLPSVYHMEPHDSDSDGSIPPIYLDTDSDQASESETEES